MIFHGVRISRGQPLRFLSQRYSSRPIESDPRKHRGPPKQSIVQPKGTVLKLSGINGL